MLAEMSDSDGKNVKDYYEFEVVDSRTNKIGRWEYSLSYEGSPYKPGTWYSETSFEEDD